MHRRALFRIAGATLGSLVVTGDETTTARDMFASIVAGDDRPLATIQTSHAVDHAIQRLAVRETRTVARLVSWLNDGSDAVLRVNARGILAKTGSPDLADDVALALARDADMRALYLSAVAARVGTDPERLTAELTNENDSGARWCSAYLLTQQGHTAPLLTGLRTERSREIVRALGVMLAGGNPCT